MGLVYEEKVRMFFNEHLHEDEEIRYILDGNGFFDVRNNMDEWVRIRVEKDDLIILPSGTVKVHEECSIDADRWLRRHLSSLYHGQQKRMLAEAQTKTWDVDDMNSTLKLCDYSRTNPSGHLSTAPQSWKRTHIERLTCRTKAQRLGWWLEQSSLFANGLELVDNNKSPWWKPQIKTADHW